VMLDGVLLERVSLENVNWNRGVRKMTDSRGLSWHLLWVNGVNNAF
jgi:hypothetical protein